MVDSHGIWNDLSHDASLVSLLENGIGSNLWPMDTSYATYIYNHIPNAEDIATYDLFNGTKFTRHKFIYIHMWGCPVYILDTTIQQGCQLPKLQPQSCCRIFVGFSSNNSSDVPLILNPGTGYISPKFHVIFDDSFSTVLSIYTEEEPPFYGINLISMIFYTRRLLMIMLRLFYMHNVLLLTNYRRENACGFALIKFVRCTPIKFLLNLL